MEEKTLTLEQMRKLVTYGSTGWDNKNKAITTKEGLWKWNDDKDCYELIIPNQES